MPYALFSVHTAGVLAWDALARELLKYGYHPAQFIELSCPDCGEWRVAVPEAPPDTYPCPNCGSLRRAARLCHGYTRRAMPFSEQIAVPLNPTARRWILSTERKDDQNAVLTRALVTSSFGRGRR